RWDRKDGTVKFDKVARTGQVDITLEMASINTGTEAFDKHLRTADFFDVEKHPTARFTADRFVFNSDQLAQVVGSLTLMGKVHPLTLHAQRFGCVENPMLKREVCGGDFQAVLDRTLFGMEYGIPRGVAKEVRLTLQVEAILQD
ncbi:MAG: YceI family protein, partial [Actinomycetota bacterium]|nr:YceI family protein [Actinomycetota bacterium]